MAAPKPISRAPRPVAAVALWLAAACLFAPAVLCQPKRDWWDAAWPYRKVLEVPAGEAPAYRVWVHAGKRAHPGGRDIRVIGPSGRPVPFGIVHSTREGRHLLVFAPEPAAHGQEQGRLYGVYFGNPAARAAAQSFPRCGLTLETRAIPEQADVTDWPAALETLRRAEQVHGKDFWGRVFDAYNPFGPQSDYISIYDGYIECPADGLYRFAVLSDDASFLIIDGALIAQWPGRGHDINAGRYGEYGGQRALSAGPHSFRYVAFAFGGPKRCGVCWVLPGAEKAQLPSGVPGYRYQVVPGSAFRTVPEAVVKSCQHVRNPVCADFRVSPKRYLESGSAQMVAVQFQSLSTVEEGTVRAYEWDFGDGQTSAEPDPEHVYLACGTYRVSLAVTSNRGARDVFRFDLDVEPLWHDLNFDLAKKNAFLNLTKDYVLERLPTGSLLALREFLHDVEQRARLFETCVELDKRREALEPLQLYDVAIDLGQYYLDPLGEWKTAERYFELALAQCAEDDRARQFNARFHLADLYFYYANDLDRAEEAYRSLRRDFPGTDPVRSRVALIRLGDIQRNRGNVEAAREIYAEAEADPTYGATEPPAIVEGRYTHEVESYLQQGQGKLALETLEQWLWRCPTKRLEGYPMVLRLKANMLMNNYDEVRKQAAIYIGFATDPDYIPLVHVLAGEACLELGLVEEARAHWKRVVENWKESPAFKDAEDGLYRLEH